MGKLPASTGWQWFKQGFVLFRQQPGILTMLLFANLLITLVISSVPAIGPPLAAILIPSLSIAVMKACSEIEQGRRVAPRVILTGFQQPGLRALCKLGLVYLGVSLVLTLLAKFMIDPEVMNQMAGPASQAAAAPATAAGTAATPGGAPAPLPPAQVDTLLTVLMLQLLALIALVALSFSAPLTYWQKMPTGKATFYSVFAILGAIKPVIVLLLSWFGMLMTVGIIVLVIFGNASAGRVVLAWIVLLFALQLQCALYASYRQIFGDPAALDDPKA